MNDYCLQKIRERSWEIALRKSKNNVEFPYLYKSKVDPSFEREQIINRIDFNFHKNIIIFGIQNTELIYEIYKRKSAFSTMMIIEITNDEELFFSAQEGFLELFKDRNVNFIIGKVNEVTASIEFEINSILRIYNMRNLEILVMPYLKSSYSSDIQYIINHLFEKIHASISGFGNDPEDILWGMDNFINNWSGYLNSLDVKYLKDKYQDIPAIIVGAGPSLDKNIEFLKNLEGKALVLSVDAAVASLQKNNITPDAISSLERGGVYNKFFEKMTIPENAVFIGSTVVEREVLNSFNKIIHTGRSGDAFFRSFIEELSGENLEIGLNVANVPFAFANYVGCNPIIFVGLDLAYSDGITHASEVSEKLNDEEKGYYLNNTTYVKGQNGEVLQTFEYFMYAKVWFEKQIARNKNVLYINATEGGAQIEGTINKKLSEVINLYCKNYYKEPLLINYYDSTINEYKKDKKFITEKAIKYMHNLRENFEGIEELANKCIIDLSKLKKGKVTKIQENRQEIDKKLDESIAMRFILQPIYISYNRDLHSFPIYLDTDEENGLYKRSMHYYETLISVSRKVRESVDAYISVLENYINLYKEHSCN